MARARLLKPDFFDDEKMAQLPFAARLLFQALWTLADREGRLEDRPEKIAAYAFPYDNPLQRKARKEAPDMLDLLIVADCVERYEADGQACLWLPHFKDHQKVHDREAQSMLPQAPGEQRIALGAPRFAQGMKSPPEAEAVREAEAEAEREAEAEAAPSLPFTLAFVKRYQERNSLRRPPDTQHAEAIALEREHGADWCFRAAEAFDWQKPPAYLRPWIIDHKEKANGANSRRPSGGVPDAGSDTDAMAGGVSDLERRRAALAERRRSRSN